MPTRDQIMDGMVTALAPIRYVDGAGLTSTRYVHKLGRYAGKLDTTEETFQRGVAGRTPAIVVGYENERTLHTTIGHKTARVEATFNAVCIVDAARPRDDRKTVYAMVEDARRLLGSRHLGLGIAPLRYVGDQTIQDDEKMLAIAARFVTRYRVDFTKDPGADVIEEVEGDIVNAENTLSTLVHAPAIAIQGTPGTTGYGWALVAVDADGLRSLISETATTTTGPATLNGTDFARLTWAAAENAATYEIHRVESSGSPATLGLIGTTALLTFDDTGLAPSEDTAPEQVHVALDLTF